MIESTLHVSRGSPRLIAIQYPLQRLPSPPLAMSAVGHRRHLRLPDLAARPGMAKYSPPYAYEFNDENAPAAYPSPGFPYAATHAAELQYLFGLPASSHGTLSAPQQRLAATMQQEWTSFAKTGVPSAPDAASWPQFVPAGQQMLSLVPPKPQVQSDFGTEHDCGLWALGGD